jgi:hypothetical protein
MPLLAPWAHGSVNVIGGSGGAMSLVITTADDVVQVASAAPALPSSVVEAV